MKEHSIISCKIAARLISESLDHRLSIRQWLSLKTHLAVCDACLLYRKQLRSLQEILGHYTQSLAKLSSATENSLSAKAKERMKSLLGKTI